MSFRSLLFVPGTRPERFAKAMASGADAVCVDLEDAVPPTEKSLARAELAAFLASRARNPSPSTVGVRINGPSSAEAALDAQALLSHPPAFVMLPKVESCEALDRLGAWLGPDGPPLWALIESAEGLMQAWAIAAHPRLVGVLFGGADFAADIGSDMGWDALSYARGRLVAACARAGVELLDVPYLDVANASGLEAETRRVRAMGFSGRACIHPSQIEPVHRAFSPSAAELAAAHRVLDAFAAAGGGPALLDGKLIEAPVIRQAQRALARTRGS